MPSWTAPVIDRLPGPWGPRLRGEPGVWLVGGAVRDLLLDRVPTELDVLVEGDAVALARRLGTPVATFERFGTATLPGLDLAATRSEAYAVPGALPDVTLGATVREDLARRDFTVNALAVRLADGEGAAFPGALADLEARVLRVLHADSFLDDPTRLLRLARYTARLGFAVERETAQLAEDAVSLGALAAVSGDRIGAELRLLCAEAQPAGVAALEAHGLGRAAVHPAFAAYRPLLRAALDALPRRGAEPPADADPDGAGPGRAEPAGPASPGDGDPGLTALAAACVEVPRHALRARLGELGIPARERDVVVAAAAARELALRLGGARRASDVVFAIGDAPVEAVAVAAALGAAEPAARWLAEWRHVRPAITGADLVAADLEGPIVGAGLRAALVLALDEPGAGRDAQLAAALRAAGR